MYAPDVGRLGLDMARKVTRIGAWQQVKKTEPVSNINSGAPWYPECGGYAVCCISDGIRSYSMYAYPPFQVYSFNLCEFDA